MSCLRVTAYPWLVITMLECRVDDVALTIPGFWAMVSARDRPRADGPATGEERLGAGLPSVGRRRCGAR
jgi:hypothetical protein